MNDAEIFYKAILALVDRELKAKVMTTRDIAQALVLALAKLNEAAPDESHRKTLRSIDDHLERIGKGESSAELKVAQ
jgi:hypothetical protein